ncbi:MAG: AAA family ATPase [Nannocystis sp.]|uniref:AAA family ATPase n=1 Tax=Nannocystis sp. TaxID=1962667 RepID=UPI002421CF2C|nr:AAA family ATPase [Nannocystis sp.]MBK9757184.1 AAA family ATPase [Nannocystis sp.]
MGHHKLRRLRVYGGFLDKLDISFVDGLCCVIGGRGSGKTTVLEFIRHALDRAPKATGPGSKQADERLRGLLAANLGASGCIELEFESQEGLVYNIRRTAHEPPVITDAAGKQLKAEMLGSSVLVDAAIFSHNQIEDIAQNPAAQRELIDRLSSQSLQTLEARMAQTTSLLRENAQRIVQLQVRIAGATRNLVDLSSWESKLAAATVALGGEASPAFKAAADHKALREQEKAALVRAHEAVARLRHSLGEAVPAQIRGLGGLLPDPLFAGPNGKVFADLSRELVRKQTELEVLLSSPLERLGGVERALASASEQLAAAHRPQDAEYAALTARAEQSSARLAARDEAAREVARLGASKLEVVELETALAEARAARTRLRQDFAQTRRDRSDRRAAIAEQVSDRLGGKVRVIVARDAELTPYREFLAGLMRRSGKQYTAPIERLTAALGPDKLGALADREDAAALAASADINPEFAETLIRGLREQPERRFELDVLDLEDVPRIELQVHGEWRSADRLSTGQKSSAILPILLMDSEAPLLIDQPEDNLDNSFISDAVIPQLKAIRGKRQLVLITHNPNLPVLGEAAQVVVLEADGRHSKVIAQGDVEAVKQHIVRLMEGGREAFHQRAVRYGE